MRVGIDARLVGPGLGVSTFICELTKSLVRSALVDVVWIGATHAQPEGVEVVASPPGGFGALDGPQGSRFVKRLGIDLMHFTANSGWWHRGSTRHVVTVHDLIWAGTGWRGHSLRQVVGHAYLRRVVPRCARAAAAVATPSATTARAIHEAWNVQATVIPNGVDDEWRTAVPLRSPESPYVVAFAGRDPRKAVDLALAAWRTAAVQGQRLLVLAGAGLPPGFHDEAADEIRSGRVEVMQYLDSARLRSVVAGSRALLYPSRDEGFGLPVLEAMAAGVPVITGLTPVTREIGGDAVLLADPADPVTTMAAELQRLSNDPGLAAALRERGRERATLYSWAAAGAAYLELYQSASGR